TVQWARPARPDRMPNAPLVINSIMKLPFCTFDACASIGGASLGVRRQGTQWIMRICAGNTSLLLHDSPLEAVAAFAGIADVDTICPYRC
ncbi:MAG: hypothetical protein ACK55Z_22610, partial [bacterium]